MSSNECMGRPFACLCTMLSIVLTSSPPPTHPQPFLSTVSHRVSHGRKNTYQQENKPTTNPTTGAENLGMYARLTRSSSSMQGRFLFAGRTVIWLVGFAGLEVLGRSVVCFAISMFFTHRRKSVEKVCMGLECVGLSPKCMARRYALRSC